MAAFVGALLLGGSLDEAFALAGVLALAIVLRALARTLPLAGVRTDALHHRATRATRCRGPFLRHGCSRQE
jgi:hypothetical protein